MLVAVWLIAGPIKQVKGHQAEGNQANTDAKNVGDTAQTENAG